MGSEVGARGKVRSDVSVLVFEGVADRGLRPRTRRPIALIGEPGAVVFAEIGEGGVKEFATGIDKLLRVGLQVVVLESSERVLPRAGTADGKLAAGEEVVLVGDLV